MHDLSAIGDSRLFKVLPRRYYVSAEIFEEEIDKVFSRQWIFLGHVSQIPNVGDYFVEAFVDESIIVVRQSPDTIRAFLNVCRHRGHRLCAAAAGNLRHFNCPYHQWGYALDGTLTSVPASPDGEHFDYRDWSLFDVTIEIFSGFIFAWLSDQPGDSLASHFETNRDQLMALEPEAMKLVHLERYPIQANWKVLLENYLECNHCVGAHPELCYTMDVNMMYRGTDGWKGQYFFGPMPLKPRMKTASMDGALVSKPLGSFGAMANLPDAFCTGFGVLPILTRVIFHIDHAIVHTLRPVDVGQVRWETRWYVRGDALEGKDYSVDRLIALWHVTNQEDIALCENAYQGVRSRRFASGPLHAKRESAIHATLETYLEMMNAD